MRQWIRSHLTYANVMSTMAVFLVIGGGTAFASYVVSSNSQIGAGTVSGHKPPTGKHANIIGGSVAGKDLASGAVGGAKLAPDSVDGSKVLDGSLSGSDIANGSLGGAQVGDGSLSSADIQDNGLTGADISEGTLAEVPSARVGGYGRSNSATTCDPTSSNYIDCVVLTVNLPTQSRVLLTGTASGGANGDSTGDCKLVTQFGDVASTDVFYSLQNGDIVPGSLVGITGQLGPGSVDFGIDCRQNAGDIVFSFVHLSAVAISPD
jgi:hypothetical protein